MSTRRTILRGIIGSLAASVYALAGGPTTSTAAAAQQGDRQWFEESLSGTRDATQEERDSILPDLHNRVIEAGHPSETVDVAATGVTASVSSRGNTVLKAALMMSEELFFILVKETSESSAPRTALLAFYTDGENIVRRLNEREAAPGGLDDSLAAGDGVNCCGAFGMPPATCCTYDYQALFECCTPCVFGGVPLGIACVMLWCNYCAVAHCTEYYPPCEDWW